MHLKTLVLCFGILFATSLSAQNYQSRNHALLYKYLQLNGYESIVARSNANTTLVQVEDATNRYPTIGILDALARTSLMLPPSTQKVVFVTLKYGVPMAVFESSGFTPMTFQRQSRQIKLPRMQLSPRNDVIMQEIGRYPVYEPSYYKTDLIINPDLKMQFGNYDNPVEMQFNIIPEFQTLLADGLLLSASIVIPLYNELEPWGDQVRLGPTTVNYLRRLKYDFFVFGAGGYFHGNRYGVEGGIKKYFYDGIFTLDSRLGYTGYARMENYAFWFTDWQDLTYSFTAQFFEKKFKTFASLGVHRFITQNHGLRFEINRFFDEFLCGFWGTYTEKIYNGGIRISLPLPPKRYKPRGFVRPRIASYYNMTYIGRYTETSATHLYANRIMDEMLLRNNPQYLRSKLRRMAGSQK